MKKLQNVNINLSPDASEGVPNIDPLAPDPSFAEGATGEEADPLDTPGGEYDTSFPVIQKGIKDLEIVSGEKLVSKSGNDMLVFKLKTTQEDRDLNNEVVLAGFPLYHRIVITPTEDRTIQRIGKDLAIMLKAAGAGHLTPRQLINDPDVLKGSVVRAKVVVQKETDEFPTSNAIKTFVTENE